EAGVFGFQASVANTGAGGQFYLLVDGVRVPGTMTVPKTGSWSTYQTVTLNGIELSAGLHVITVFFEKKAASGFVGEFDWFAFVQQGMLSVEKLGTGGGTGASEFSATHA